MIDVREDALRRIRARLLVQRRTEKERCEASLVTFMERAWPEIEAGEFSLNWHHIEIARALQDITFGSLRNLVTNIPPRCSKTSEINIFWPAWVWAQPKDAWGPLSGPHVRFLCVSYGATLSEEIAAKMRRLVMGEWYQALWGKRVQIRSDQQNRANFANTAGGERMSNSIEGGLLGRGGDVQIIDDPHHIKGAESEVQRKETLEGMRSLVTRVTDPRIAARVLVMQRLHEDDATNYALENWRGEIRHLMFPMRFDIQRAVPEDPRGEDGELLWPEVWDEDAVRGEEKELQEYGASGQLQQAPVPRGGGIIKSAWWRLWPDDAPEGMASRAAFRCPMCKWVGYRDADEAWIECPNCGSAADLQVPFPPFSYRFVSVDTSYGEREENSFSAATSWGIWHDKDEAPRMMLTEAWRGRPRLYGEPGKTKGLIDQVYDMATRPNRLADAVLIEKKTRGVDLYNELERVSSEWPFRLVYFEPTGRGDKITRLHACVGAFTKELVWAPGKSWARTVIDEVASQPRAQFSDLADTTSQAILHARETGLIMHGEEHKREVARTMVFRLARRTVAQRIEG